MQWSLRLAADSFYCRPSKRRTANCGGLRLPGLREELRGSDRVKSTFLADMGQLFATALQADGVEGIILNPWNRTLMLEKELIRIILGQQG